MSKPLAFIPEPKYIPVSITGAKCELNCLNCRGRYLKTMIPAKTPKRLKEVLLRHWLRGGYGALISGGFTRKGVLPISKEFIEVIKYVKKETNLLISIHTGLISKELILELYSADIDFIDFEVPPSNNFLRKVKNLMDHDVNMYIKTLQYMLTLRKDFAIPHIIIGNKYSTSNEELRVLEEISNLNPCMVTVLAEIHMHKGIEDLVTRVINSLKHLRSIFRGEVTLGCMRPFRFKYLIDKLIISEGLVDRIANPHPDAAKKFKLRTLNLCCSVPNLSKYI